MSRKQWFGLLVLSMLWVAGPLAALEQDFGYWSEYGVRHKLDQRWQFSSNAQVRWRDNAGDLNYLRIEGGPSLSLNQRFSLGALFRVSPKESGESWSNEYYLLLDPTVKLYSSPGLGLDFRARIHQRVGDLGRSFVRLRPRVSCKFELGDSPSSWFLYNEWYLQTSEPGTRDRYNQNWLTSGFNFGLPGELELSVYYQLTSNKLAAAVPELRQWSHAHILGTAIYLSY